MSRRHLRKVFGNSSNSSDIVISDSEEYESDKARTNTYAVLGNHTSESESDSAAAVTPPPIAKPDINEGKKKEKRKKKKQRRKSNKSQSGSGEDIDELVREVNAVLGEPSCAVIPERPPKHTKFEILFSIKKKHLNSTNELNRFFGAEKKKHNQAKDKDTLKNQIAPYAEKFKVKGMSMSVNRIENGFTYYCYDHSGEYQQRHKDLLQDIEDRQDILESPLQTSLKNMHVEGILEAFVLFCRGEDYNAANMALEQIISYLQFVAHPFFNIANIKTRLEYRIMENRPFHISVLLYSHILSNKACHRTALELAKMLLNLDPSDPLDVMFIIDTFAIRAREYKWLIEAVDWFDRELSVKYLFNIQLSYALAHFHIANKNKEDLETADDLLKKALIMYPVALNLLIPATAHKDDNSKLLISHPIYNFRAINETLKPLYELIALYAAFLGPRWNEPEVLKWLVRNALELIDNYENDPSVKEAFTNQKLVRQSLFRTWPIQMYRHLCLLKPLSNLLVDGAVPYIPGYEQVLCFNPAPDDDSVNRYKYADTRVFIMD